MPLTDTAIKAVKPAEKPIKLTDEKGLFLLVHPNGSRYWRMRYRFAGKEKLLALGVYPDVALKRARERRDEARALLSEGVDPGLVKQVQKLRQRQLADDSLEAIAREWFDRHLADKSANHRDKVVRRLERDVFP